MLADRTAKLRTERAPLYEVHRVVITHADVSPFNNQWASYNPTAGVWVATGTPASWPGVFSDALPGDLYEFELDSSVQIAGGGGNVYGLTLFSVETHPGPVFVGTQLVGAKYFYQTGTTTTQTGFHLVCEGTAASGITGVVGIELGIFGSTTTAIQLMGDFVLKARLLRATT